VASALATNQNLNFQNRQEPPLFVMRFHNLNNDETVVNLNNDETVVNLRALFRFIPAPAAFTAPAIAAPGYAVGDPVEA